MAEASERSAALRDARRRARRSARRSRSTASISPCAAGEVCALVGQNGAGKSTLMAHSRRARSRRTRGAMRLDGAPVRAARSARRAPGRRRDDLPGAVARAAPERDGEHRARRRAGAARHRARAISVQRDGDARRSSELGHHDISPDAIVGDLSRRRRSSSSRSRARSRAGAACSSSTSRRAASVTRRRAARCSSLIGTAQGAGAWRSSTSRTSSKK